MQQSLVAYDESASMPPVTCRPWNKAMILSHIFYESMGLQFVEEIACKGVNEESDKCPNGKYHGRGYILLSTKENHGQFSKE